ncbi:MAG: hypothetical protein OEZ13_01935 [Spirochaetia bacterium]|nr:hypothetical protein [Spirochaetia bacterium]
MNSFLIINCSKNLQEIEPQNNKREMAQELKSGIIVNGALYSEQGKDIDYYFARTDNDKMLKAKLSQMKGIDSRILLFRKGERNPYKIINDNASSIGEEFAPLLIEPPGIVIAIEPIERVNDIEQKKIGYEFSINLLDAHYPFEKEDNDSFETAQEITEEIITGYYNNKKINDKNIEKDYYYFNVSEEEIVLCNISVTAVKKIDPVLRIYDENKNLLHYSQEKGEEQTEDINSLGLQGPGRYFISLNDNNGNINTDEYYELKVELKKNKKDTEFEPNDIFEKATIISEEKTTGQIADSHDIDIYLLENKNEWPVEYSITVTPAENMDIKAEIYKNENSESLIFNDDQLEKKEGISNLRLLEKERIFMKITAVKLAKETGAQYYIQVEERNLTDNIEIEPNNTKETAQIILPGSEILAYINPNNDIDYYKIKNENDGKYKIMVDGITGCFENLFIADRKGYKTDEYKSAKEGDGISISTNLESGGFIGIFCEKHTKNLFNEPYKILIQTID